MTLSKKFFRDEPPKKRESEFEFERKIRRSMDSEARFWMRKNDFLAKTFFLKYVYLKGNSESSIVLNPDFDFFAFAKSEKDILSRINNEIKYLFENNEMFKSLQCMFERGEAGEFDRTERRLKKKSLKTVIDAINSKEEFNTLNGFSRYLKNKYEPSKDFTGMGTRYLRSEMSEELESELLSGISNELKRFGSKVLVYDLSFSNESLYSGIVRKCRDANKSAVFFFNGINNNEPAYFFMKTWFLGYRNVEVNCIKEPWYKNTFTDKKGCLQKYELVFGNIIDIDTDEKAHFLDDESVTILKSFVKILEKKSNIPKENYIYYFLLEIMDEKSISYIIDNFSFLTYKNYYELRKNLVDEGLLSRAYSIYGETYSRANVDPVMMVWDRMNNNKKEVFFSNFKRMVALTKEQNLTSYELKRRIDDAGRNVSRDAIAVNDYNLNISNYLPDANLSPSQKIEETVEKLNKSVDTISERIRELSRQLGRFK
ncbi:MAG: hypothetical protein AB7T10_03345 [bacterium]